MDSAARVWVKGDEIVVLFPPLPGLAAEHTVTFPADAKGMALLLVTLRARNRDSLLGQIGSPTKYQLERALVDDKRYNEWIRALAPKMSFDEAMEGL